MIFVNRRRIIQNSGIAKDPTKYWYIEKYVYGKLKETVEVPLGTGTTFGSIDSGYSDDTFYGWSISSTSTKRTFTATTKYKNTTTAVKNALDSENTLKIYAIYKYTETYDAEVQTRSVMTCTSGNATHTVNDAIIGKSYTIKELTASIGNSSQPIYDENGNTIGRQYTVSISYSDGVTVESGTTTSSTISYTHTYSQVSERVTVGLASATSQPTSKIVTADSPQSQITYYHIAKKTTAKYRVESHT